MKLGYVKDWNPVVADRHAAATERMLLGWCGPAIVTKTAEAIETERILADRERRAEAMRFRRTAVRVTGT